MSDTTLQAAVDALDQAARAIAEAKLALTAALACSRAPVEAERPAVDLTDMVTAAEAGELLMLSPKRVYELADAEDFGRMSLSAGRVRFSKKEGTRLSGSPDSAPAVKAQTAR